MENEATDNPTDAEMEVATEMEASQPAAEEKKEAPPKSSPVKKGPPSMPSAMGMKSKWAPKIHQSKLDFSAKPNGVKVMTDLTKSDKKEKPADPDDEGDKKAADSDDEGKKKPKPKKASVDEAANGVKKSKAADSDDEGPKKSKAKDSDDEGSKKKSTPKKAKKEEEQDPEKELAKLKKERMRELIKAQKRKERKRKRANSLIDDSADKSGEDSGDEKEIDTDDEKITEEDRAFIKRPDETESESDDEASDEEEGGKKKKKKKKDKKKKRKAVTDDEAMEVTEAEAEAEELDAHMKDALEAVGSRSSKKGKKASAEDRSEASEEKGGKSKESKGRVCNWCDKVVEKGWITLRGELTGTGNKNCYFHAECTSPFIKESEKLRKAGEKPPTAVAAKAKKSSDKPKEKKEDKKEKKEEPKAKKAKVAVDIVKAIEAFGKAREGFDRFITHLMNMMGEVEVGLTASEMDSFAKSWASIDKRMQEIEDGKTKNLPDWPFDQSYKRDVMWFYLMASEHGFKEFKKIAKKVQDKS